jgi:N-methylhydantoinase B
VTADRVRLGCYGVAGGKAGEPFCVTVDLHGAAKRLGGLVDGEPVKAGQVVRVVTTGGGGWGDPLEREPERVLRDVVQRKVSPEAARREYGVALVARETEVETVYTVDEAATARLRAEIRGARKGPLPLIDRGPGYERMLRGEEAPRL